MGEREVLTFDSQQQGLSGSRLKQEARIRQIARRLYSAQRALLRGKAPEHQLQEQTPRVVAVSLSLLSKPFLHMEEEARVSSVQPGLRLHLSTDN